MLSSEENTGQLDVMYIKISKHVIKTRNQVEIWGVRQENSQQLTVLVGYPKDLISVPNCHVRQFTLLVIPNPGLQEI